MSSFHQIYEEWIEEGKNTPTLIQGTLNFLSHWTFQSITRMDSFERAFKILCTVLFTAVFHKVGKRLTTAFVIGHSLNFVLNSHVIATFKTFNLSYYSDWDEFETYATALLDKLSDYDWVRDVYVTGSVNRDEWTPTSDLDVNVVRNPGISNGIKGVIFALWVRFSATLNLFPIDLYVFDSKETFEGRRINEDETIIPYSAIEDISEIK